MKKIETMCKSGRVNEISKVNSGYHIYVKERGFAEQYISLQRGSRYESVGIHEGVFDVDLVEIVHHNLVTCKKLGGMTPSKEKALIAIKEALKHLGDDFVEQYGMEDYRFSETALYEMSEE